jgi:hypothetical protein
MQQLQALQPTNPWGTLSKARSKRVSSRNAKQLAALGIDSLGQKKAKKEKRAKKKRGSRLEFKRVDQLWDSTIHNYKLTDTAEDEESSEYDQYLFNVRRTFDWEGKYRVRSEHIVKNARAYISRLLLSISKAGCSKRR